LSRAAIYLLRHGETEWNVAGRLQGALDSPLTERGCEQARRLAATLARNLGATATMTMQASPLGRTRRTAAIVAAALGFPTEIAIEPRLREITMGCWDGLTQVEIESRYPGSLKGANRYDRYFRAPDGETYDAARARVRSWLDEQEGAVIAVSHGITSRLIRGAYLDLPREATLSLPSAHNIVWLLRDGRVAALASESASIDVRNDRF
jgi:probable phosphoglycerate mutase